MISQEQIDRINALAKKAKAEGLTEEETAERAELRRLYVASVRENLTAQLDNTYIMDKKGIKHKLEPKKK